MTFQDFINKWNGKGIDFDGYYGDQCMDLMHQYCVEVLGLVDGRILAAPSAKDVYLNFNNVLGHENFDKIDNTPTGVPQNGDIMFWGTGIGPYGHVAVFVEGDSNKFRSFDQNFPTDSKCHIQEHTYKGVLGWLRGKTNAVMATITQVELDEIIKARDDNWNSFQEEKANVSKLTEDLKKEQVNSQTYLDQLQKITEEEKNTTEQLLTAQHALQPFKDEQEAIRKALGSDSTDHLVDDVKALKASKVKQTPKPVTLLEKLRFLFS